jgi:hypothetical protein
VLIPRALKTNLGVWSMVASFETTKEELAKKGNTT